MKESLILRTERQGHIAFFDVSGYINNTGGEQIADSCNDLIAEGIHHFIFDLDRCAAVNSVGILILIELIEKTKNLRGKLAFCRVNQTPSKAFRIMGLLQNSSLHDTRTQAEQALGL
jgi:anti-anti-sigma factor